MKSYESMLETLENIFGKSSVPRNQFRDFKGFDIRILQSLYEGILSVEYSNALNEQRAIERKLELIQEAMDE